MSVLSRIEPSANLKGTLANLKPLQAHAHFNELLDIISGETNLSTAGFPFISDRSFRIFIRQVPHLFQDGVSILKWLETLDQEINTCKNLLSEQDLESINRAKKVLQTIVFTAGVTAPPDLWILRQVLSAHKKIGSLDLLIQGHALDPEVFAVENGLNLKQLRTDLHFLYCCGYLERGDGNFLISRNTLVAKVLEGAMPILEEQNKSFVKSLVNLFSNKGTATELVELKSWLCMKTDNQANSTQSWIANNFQIELGYHLLPIVLALRVLALNKKLISGVKVKTVVPNLIPEITFILQVAGITENGLVTDLGARVFARGPGPYGIIGAYHPYLSQLEPLLRNEKVSTWVKRGENVSASQDANSKTFKAANDALDRFAKKYTYNYEVYIEHAIGQGEATRQRFVRDGEKDLRYFGADLEDPAIESAIAQQKRGKLPSNMKFIRNADIGQPQIVIDFLKKENLENAPIAMVVGNGFHEIRQQTNEKMIEVFRQYGNAGFILVFTEESALHDEALLQTAWNTYHAGFRYVHEVSGQGLRPAFDREQAKQQRWSWGKCAKAGGYVLLEGFSYRSRTIYPYKRPKHKNPSISVTYFCVPKKIARKIGLLDT